MTGRFNKVFGIGLSRTGTQSLSAALNELGLTSVHFPNDDATFRQLRSGDFDLEVLERATALCDTPVVPYYPQLDEAFPGSKFILTLRDDREAWLASVERLWRCRPHIPTHPYHKFITAAVYGTWHFSRSRFAYVYDLHVRNVRSYFQGRTQDLLELRICDGEGWAQLAPFLGMDVPSSTFPHADSLGDLQEGETRRAASNGPTRATPEHSHVHGPPSALSAASRWSGN